MNAVKPDRSPSLAAWLAAYILAPDHNHLHPYRHAQAELRDHAAYVLNVRGPYPPALMFRLLSALDAVPEVRAVIRRSHASRVEFLLSVASAADELLKESI